MLADDDLGLWVVADGMGGYEGGEIASRIAVDTIQEIFRRTARDADATWPFKVDPLRSMEENLALVAIRAAHLAIVAQREGRLASMGSTVAMVAADAGRAVVAHMGDSRVYRLRDGQLARLTRDHSFVEEMALLDGTTGRVRGEASQFAHMITRALGMPNDHRPDVRVEALRAGDVLVLCSDGLVEGLDDAQIADILGAAVPGDEASALATAAHAAGARDNVTVVVVRVQDE